MLLAPTMPRMSGMEAYAALASCANRGLAGFVQQPFRTEELLAALPGALAQSAGP